MVLAEFSMTPLGERESMSRYVARCMEVVQQSGVTYRLTPMGTILEGSIDQVLEVVHRCFEVLASDCHRITCSAKFDYRQGDQSRLDSKVASVEKVLGRTVCK